MIFFDRYVPYGKPLDIRSVTVDEYKEVISLIEEAYNLYNDNSFIVYKDRSMQPCGTYFCGAGVYNQICVPNGDRYICSRYQIKSGNWFKDSVEELYNNALRWEEKVLQTPEDCFDCIHKKICNGGMRCLTYAVTGEFNKKDIHCYRYERDYNV
jgi:radical SAM protein with 4Fe4S-binding SPASM domain